MSARIAIIGCGAMGSAFYRGLVKVFDAAAIVVCDEHQEKLTAVGAPRTTTSPEEAALEADVVLLAVKPQSFAALTESVEVFPEKLVLSIMAGIDLARLGSETGSSRIVRAMPNLAASVGRSVTAWTASSACSESDRTIASQVWRAVGRDIELPNETLLDAFTAIAGSGPAYYFLLCEVLEAQARRRGFTEEQARTIVRETFVGSALALDASEASAAAWRANVTSKGGTTEAALRVLAEQHWSDIMGAALSAAERRSRDLRSPQ